jgi:2-methylisocitrate lyase-like PEP mutase family enzyme
MPTQLEKAKTLKTLHERRRAFIIANAWDAGSARLLAGAGFAALATTGAGVAFSRGQPDATPGREALLENARTIVAATDLPVSADLENGFGDAAETVSKTIRLAIEIGLAGGSIEDATYRESDPVYELALAADRVRAAVEAVAAQSVPFQLVARAENFLYGRPDLADTIRRLQAFQEAGADVLFAPGLTTAAQIRSVVAEVDRPVNVLMGLGGSDFTLDDLAALGVARISVGSALLRRAYAAVMDAAREMTGKGTFGFIGQAIPFAEINAALRAQNKPESA